jgi:hypothetical protein
MTDKEIDSLVLRYCTDQLSDKDVQAIKNLTVDEMKIFCACVDARSPKWN